MSLGDTGLELKDVNHCENKDLRKPEKPGAAESGAVGAASGDALVEQWLAACPVALGERQTALIRRVIGQRA